MHTELFKRIKFHETSSVHSLVLFFDLEDYSKFMLAAKTKLEPAALKAQLDSYLNHIFAALNICFHGGDVKDWDPYWLTNSEKKSWQIDSDQNGNRYHGFAEPNHFKFQGDGALYVWETPTSRSTVLIERLLGLRINFSKIMDKWLEKTQLPFDVFKALPANIRFGLSAGTLTKLAYWNNPDNTASAKEYLEYVGYDVNLAARLQGYCKREDNNNGIGFIASDRISISPEDIRKNGLRKVTAVSLKGCSHEDVLVVESEYNDYKSAARKEGKFIE